jgi:ABC-type transport system substrate-binding protein
MSYELAEAELKSAIFDDQSVWNTGFNLTIPYTSDNLYYFFASIRDFFSQLSTYDERSSALPPFTINLRLTTFSNYLSYWAKFKLPFIMLSWLPDFADADNLIRAFMYGGEACSYLSNYTAANGWGSLKDELIRLASKTPDGPERAAIYAELEQMYIDDCPSVPLYQTMHRKFLKYWVKGWYCNPQDSSDNYYHLWKEDTCWADITGETLGVADGISNMRDIGYICNRFGAKAPDPSRTPPLDPKWESGTYGLGCADIYGDRRVDMRDIGEACAHFGDRAEP